MMIRWPKGFSSVLVLLLVLAIALPSGGQAGDGLTAALEDAHWQLEEAGGSPVSPLPGEGQPFITFDAQKKRATGYSGCNNFFGGYEIAGSSLKFGPIGASRKFCAGEAGEVEMRFLQTLEQTRSWEVKDCSLLFLDRSKVLARFIRVSGETREKNTPEITGTVWQWVQTIYNDDRKVVPEEPNYTVQFLKDGTLSVKADCNMKGGTYSVSAEEKRLSIELTHSTMASCPEGSLEDEFVRGLSGAAIYFFRDGELYLDLKYDAGTMKFSVLKGHN